jgi:hypothetical protein
MKGNEQRGKALRPGGDRLGRCRTSRRRDEGSHRGTRQRNIRVFVLMIIRLFAGDSGAEARASELLINGQTGSDAPNFYCDLSKTALLC